MDPGHWYGGKPQSAKTSWILDEPVPGSLGHEGQPEYFTTCVVGPKQTHAASGHEQLTWYSVLPAIALVMLSHSPLLKPEPPPAGIEASEALAAAASVATTAAQSHAA